MEKIHDVEYIRFSHDSFILKVDGQEYRFLLSEISRKLSNASEEERNLSIDGLLGIIHAPPVHLTKRVHYSQAA
jgi:hypothetical protein